MAKNNSPTSISKIPAGFWTALLLALAAFLVSINFIPELGTAKTARDFIANSIPLALGTVSLISAGLILRKKEALGGGILITFVLILLILVPVLAEGYGLPAGMAAFVFTSLLSWQTMPRRLFGYISLVGFGVAALIIFLEVFWPFPRISQDTQDIQTTTILVIFLSIVYLIILATQFQKYPMRTKMIISFILLATIPTAVVTVLINMRNQDQLTLQANQSLVNTASQAASQIEAFLQRNLDEMRIEAQNVSLVNYINRNPWSNASLSQREAALTTLMTLKQKDPINVNSYGLISPQGLVVLDTDPNLMGYSHAEEDFVRRPLQTGLPYVSSILFNEDGTQSIYFTAPIRNSVGEISGLLRMDMNAAVLQQNVLRNSENIEKETTLVLLDENGLVLAHNNEINTLFRTLVDVAPDFRADLVRRKRLPLNIADEQSLGLTQLAEGLGSIKESANFTAEVHSGKALNELVGAVKMESVPWYMIASQGEAYFLRFVTQQTRIATLLGLAAAVLATIIGGIGSTFLTRPILRLTETAKKIASGDMNVHAPVMTQDEIGALAETFNNMTGQIRSLVGTLEQRVADRTRALETSTEVSRRLSTILDEAQLVRAVVDQLQTAFSYYHVHIYLFDNERRNLVMRGGTGEAGRLMLASGHKIPLGRGLVGTAAEHNMPRLVGDVSQDPNWLPNALLPETRSEIAVPIAVGNEVLGVLDVQQNITNGLGMQDIAMVQSITNQVAIALRNAQSYAKAEQQAEREALVANISQRLQHYASLEEILQAAVNELGHVLGAQSGSVELHAGRSKDNK